MTEDKKEIMCNRCHKLIKDAAFVFVQPAIVLSKYAPQAPPLFTCREHAENFYMGMYFHDDCWIGELKDHGVQIHDMKKVKEEYAKGVK